MERLIIATWIIAVRFVRNMARSLQAPHINQYHESIKKIAFKPKSRQALSRRATRKASQHGSVKI